MIHLSKMILITPATNVISEGSFSTLKVVKTMLSAMIGNRLHHLHVVDIYHEQLDETNL